MNCSKCGFFNNPNAKFCVKCGQPIENVNMNNVGVVQQDTLMQSAVQTLETQNGMINGNIVSNTSSNVTSSTMVRTNQKVSFMSYFYLILAVILKPFTTFKEELGKFANLKNSVISALVVSVFATLVRLLSVMLSVVRVEDYDLFKGSRETKWVWENLKNLDYIDVIGNSLLVFLGIILIIAAGYYLVSLIMKKQANFAKMLGIASISVVPMYLATLVLSPLVSLITVKLGMPIILIGGVYTIILIYEAMNTELNFEGNTKYYFNLICLSIIGIASYYLYSKFLGTVSVPNNVGDILDMIR